MRGILTKISLILFLGDIMPFKVFFIIVFCLFVHHTQAKLSVLAKYTSYMTSTHWKDQLNHYMNIGLNFQKYKHYPNWFYGSEIDSLFSLDKSYQNYLTFPDLFLGYKRDFNQWRFNFILGRHKRVSSIPLESNKQSLNQSTILEEPWSAMDEIWQLGLWQGRLNWDYLQPQQTGLTGAFFTIEKKPWLFSVFVSSVFFPEHSPVVDIKEGEVRSDSRWFTPPQSQFVAFNQRIDALYWLSSPYLKNIILNESLAFRFRFGDRTKQWFSMAYGYKPINQLYFKVDSTFSIDKKSINNVIHYQPFQHSLISMDFGLTRGIFKTILSVTQEIPYRPKSPGKGLVPTLPKALFFSAHTNFHLAKYRWFLENFKLNFIYSHFTSIKQTSSEPKLNLDLNINRFKMPYGFAFSAKTKPLEWQKQSLAFKLSYWYSIPEQGGWLNASLQWKLTPTLYLQSDMDILGVEKKEKKSFFNSYKQNDRIRIMVNYAFN